MLIIKHYNAAPSVLFALYLVNSKSLDDGTTIFCPSDIQRFCDYEKCIKDNECQKGKGLCLNGKCLYAE